MNHTATLKADYIMPSGERILIRPIEKADLPGLEWDGEYTHFRRLYQQHYESSLGGNTLIWVAANNDGEIIGQVFLLLLSKQRELADGVFQAYLFSFRIKPAYRDQGLGGFMLEMMENAAQSALIALQLGRFKAIPDSELPDLEAVMRARGLPMPGEQGYNKVLKDCFK